MIYKSENQIKMVLGINAWRNMLNDKFMMFIDMMPAMDQDVMMAIIKQLPQFWLFSKETLAYLEKSEPDGDSALQPNPFAEIHRILGNELGGDHYTLDQKKYFLGTIIGSLGQDDVLNEKDLAFLTSLPNHTANNARLVIMAALTFIGGRFYYKEEYKKR